MGVWYRTPTASATNILAFWESLPRDPGNAVPNLPPRILDGTREPVVRPRSAEREQMGTGLGDTQSLGPELDAWHAVIPLLAHKATTR